MSSLLSGTGTGGQNNLSGSGAGGFMIDRTSGVGGVGGGGGGGGSSSSGFADRPTGFGSRPASAVFGKFQDVPTGSAANAAVASTTAYFRYTHDDGSSDV